MALKYQILLPKLRKTMLFFSLSFIFYSNVLFASDRLVVAVGLAKPPYVIQADDSGFELDLIRNILKKWASQPSLYIPNLVIHLKC